MSTAELFVTIVLTLITLALVSIAVLIGIATHRRNVHEVNQSMSRHPAGNKRNEDRR